MQFKNIALIGKYQSTTLTAQLANLAIHLDKLGAKVYIDCGENCDYANVSTVNIGQIATWVDILDLVIVIGGDGTLLSAARGLVNHDIPVIGINQGRLGFMTDIAAHDMLSVIDDVILNGNYTIEQRSLINARVMRNGKLVMQSVALNDVVISRGAIGNMIEFNISIDGQFVLSQKSDGIIFATPTGSTAYSLAAGGPIVHPEAHVFSIVPICPQSMTNRPLVVHDNAIIEFDLVRENATQIHFDGQECFDLEFEDKVLLSKHPKQFKIIHPRGYSYFHTLRTKLDWSKRVS
jgi:NAD+ kinase